MEIQRLGMEHFDAIVSFNKLCFPLDPWPEEDWKMLLEDDRSIYYALMDQGNILGCIFLYNWIGEKDYVKIMDLGVHPDYRNRGFAHQLLAYTAAEMEALGMSSFRGETRESNNAMQHVFESCGYHHIATEADYYENPIENAFKYLLQL